jgi:hypothetical protein
MAACLLSGFILTTPSANVLWRSAAVPHVAQGSHFNPAASPNPESRILNTGYGPPAVGLATTAGTAQPRVVESYGRLPLSFEINKGQADSQVKFLSRGSGYSLFLTGNEAVLALRKSNSNGKRQMAKGVAAPGTGSDDIGSAAHWGSADLAFRSAAFLGLLRSPAELETDARTADPRTGSALQGLLGSAASFQFPVSNFQTPATNNEPRTTGALLRMKLVGANPNPKIVGTDELPGKSNYFIGSDPKKWRTNVANYAKVKYANVYPGVDLVYYGNQGKLEYDFVVQPGADPRAITLELETGQSKIQNRKSKIDKNGDLVVVTDGGEVIFHKPVVYQPEDNRQSSLVRRPLQSTTDKGQLTKDGGKDYVDGRYVVRSDNSVAFQVAPYDRRRPVVIDPVLAYSTYLGGSAYDYGQGIAVDASGNVYITGDTQSESTDDFPTTPGAFQTTFSGPYYDAFVSKLNAAGSALVYSTYLGPGSLSGIAVDASGNAYVTGSGGSEFPTTPGAFHARGGGGSVTKLNPTGSALVYSTASIGGAAIALDAAGNAYVTGTTDSPDFPTTPGAFQTTCGGGGGGFVSELNAAGSALLYSTYLCGGGGDGVAFDASSNIYVTGLTYSSSFPTTPGAFRTTFRGPVDAFVAKIGPADAPGIALGPGSLTFGPQPVGIASAPQAVGLLDAGSQPLSITSIVASGDFAQTNTCGSAVQPGAPCTLSVTFKPTAMGTRSGAITITDNAAGSPHQFLLTGTGSGQPALTLTPASLTFASQQVGTTSPAQPVTLMNTGIGPLAITSIATVGDFAETNNCGSTVNPGASCTVTVTFTPTAIGTRSGNVTITDDAAGSPQFVFLTGTGFVPVVNLTPPSLTFGPQGVGTTSPAQSVTLENTGDGPLSISRIAHSRDFAQRNNCGSTVNPGVSCTLNVTFTPTATGTRSGAIVVADDAPGSPQKVLLTGTGVPLAVTLAPASVPFLVLRTVGTSSLPQTVTLTNVGGGDLDITGITLAGPDPGDFAQSNHCPATVAAGASCLITVTFTPTAQGWRTAWLSITDSAPGSPQIVLLTGRGTFLEWEPRYMNLGNQAVGTSSAIRTVTLANRGPAPITLLSIEIGGANPGDFTQTNNCGSSLNAGASCTIQVTFTPTAVGGRQGHVAISDNAFGGTHWVGLIGKGT